MTENEFRLFSEFLEQRIYRGLDNDPRVKEHNASFDRYLADETALANASPEDSNKFRMSTKYLQGNRDRANANFEKFNNLRSESNKRILGIPYRSKKNDEEMFKLLEENKHIYDTANIMRAGEAGLASTGYDDKYSSKFMENLFRNKLDSSDAEQIVSKRVGKNVEYSRTPDPDGKIRSIGQNLKRKFDDASIVYEAGTDGRSLGKDAALAAGGAAALGIGIHAIKKHRKKKKAEKELLDERIKRSKD